jgi:phytoene dehydrogenase-like protein
MARKIVIVGGGIAGLSTGCYAGMNGYESEIFEMHTTPGGVCTGWARKGYTFDGCLHFLVGTSPSSTMYPVWKQLGALEGKRLIDHEVFGEMVLPGGKSIPQHADVDRLVSTLKERLPALDRHDIAELDRLAADVKLWGKLRIPMGFGSAGSGKKRKGIAASTARAAHKAASLPKMLRRMWKIRAFLPTLRRFSGSIEGYLTRFHGAELRSFLGLVNPIPRMPAASLLMMLSVLHHKEAGWPEGGSLELALSIARRYAELGGVIHYGAKVEEILVRDGRAVGVRLADGSEHFGDEVISAADGHATLFGMLGGRYVGEELAAVYRRLPLYTPIVQVSFGVKREMWGDHARRLTSVAFPAPVSFGGTEASFVFLNNYGFDPGLAPAGKSAITILFLSPWEHWEKLAGDRQAYRAEKARVLADCTAWLESRYPGISGDIEVTDVATPLTTVRYTGNYHASYEGWLPTAGTMRTAIPKRLPGLAGFSMVGQWTAPAAGLPTAAADGRTVIQQLCAQDGKEFRAWAAGDVPPAATKREAPAVRSA